MPTNEFNLILVDASHATPCGLDCPVGYMRTVHIICSIQKSMLWFVEVRASSHVLTLPFVVLLSLPLSLKISTVAIYVTWPIASQQGLVVQAVVGPPPASVSVPRHGLQSI